MTTVAQPVPGRTAARRAVPAVRIAPSGSCTCSHEQKRHYRGRGVCALVSCPCSTYVPAVA